MLDGVDLFTERDARDEIDIAPARVALADLLLPGTRRGAHLSRDVSRCSDVPSPTIRMATPVTLPTISA